MMAHSLRDMCDWKRVNLRSFFLSGCLILDLLISGCARPVRGPDKQFSEGLQGAISGAGAGAVTGAQMTAGAGPGAAVGAGLGAVAGGVRGFVRDQHEEALLDLGSRIRNERELAYVRAVLMDQMKRRAELHPQRDIYPADIFFNGDEGRLKREAIPLVREIARMNKLRFPWSRIVVASYIKSADEESEFANKLSSQRAKEIGDYLVRGGIEPRRVETRPMIVKETIMIDPLDNPGRYNQAIEFIPVDR